MKKYIILLLFFITMWSKAQSLAFDSLTVYSLPNQFDRTTTEPWTVEWWMYIDFAKDGSDDNLSYLFTSIDGGDAVNRPRFYAAVGTSAPYQLFQNYGGTFATQNLFTSVTTSRYRDWHHFAIVYTGNDEYLYLDGIAVDSLNSGTTIMQWDAFGAYDYTAIFPFKGYIDELRFWTVARSASEIAVNKDKEINPSTNGLLYYYRFNNSLASLSTQNTLNLETGTVKYAENANIQSAQIRKKYKGYLGLGKY